VVDGRVLRDEIVGRLGADARDEDFHRRQTVIIAQWYMYIV
jgi:hypothetical protein